MLNSVVESSRILILILNRHVHIWKQSLYRIHSPFQPATAASK